MAPRSAKAKKADVKVAENDAPKKGRGKAKNIEEVEDLPEVDIDEKAAVVSEKKAKRGKKAQDTNGDAHTNGAGEETAPPPKRGRKKNEPVEEKITNGDKDNSDEEEPASPKEENGDHAESNGNTEESEPATTSKGRKKPAKKEEKPKESGRGRKAKQASPDDEEKEVVEKPKGKGRGRKAQPKSEAETEEEKTEPAEEAKAEPAPKGRKKAQAKTVKEKTPESDKDEPEESEKESVEEKTEEVKKETKGRKGKKEAKQAKDDGEESEAKEEPAPKKRKVTKKEEKGKGDSKDEEDEDEEMQEAKPAETKPAKGKRGQKKAEPSAEAEEDDAPDSADAKTNRRRKPAEEKAPAEDKKKKAPAKNKATTEYDEIDFSNSSKSPHGKEWNFKISSWNVDGIRAWMNKGGLDYIQYEKPDILCLQEVKCSKEKLPDELANLPGYHTYWLGGDKDGYAGVGIYTTQLAMNVQYGLQNEEFDNEGRIITAEYEQFYLICTYVPNAGKKLVTLPKRLQWNEEFRKHVKELDKKKPVIICGDMNVAHSEIDLTNPKTNKKNAGFTEEERAGMTELLGDGFVDTYRHFYPDKTGAYTFWTYMMNARSKNVGWRLDYFIVSERLLPSVCDNVIRDQVYGSDHCPISLFLHLTSADKPKE